MVDLSFRESGTMAITDNDRPVARVVVLTLKSGSTCGPRGPGQGRVWLWWASNISLTFSGRLVQSPFRPNRENLSRFQGLLPESQVQNLASTIFYVMDSLDGTRQALRTSIKRQISKILSTSGDKCPKMAPSTGQCLQVRVWDNPTKGLLWCTSG